MGDYPGLTGGPNVITGVLISKRRRQESQNQKEMGRCHAAGLEDAGRGQEPKQQAASGRRKGKKDAGSPDISLRAHRAPAEPSDLQDCKAINPHSFKPLSLWSFVPAATGH